MIRSSGLRSGRSRLREDNNNPMDGLANLADVMLVFACGLMLALLVYWNMDFSAIQMQVLNDANLREVDNLEEASQSAPSSSGFEERGMVFEDPETGKMYMITEE